MRSKEFIIKMTRNRNKSVSENKLELMLYRK
jgi:hypothetical protein